MAYRSSLSNSMSSGFSFGKRNRQLEHTKTRQQNDGTQSLQNCHFVHLLLIYKVPGKRYFRKQSFPGFPSSRRLNDVVGEERSKQLMSCNEASAPRKATKIIPRNLTFGVLDESCDAQLYRHLRLPTECRKTRHSTIHRRCIKASET